MLLPSLLFVAAAFAEPAARNPCLRPDPARYYVSAPGCDAEGSWAGRPYRIRTNSLGLRNREVGEKKGPRLLLVGSSENYGPGLSNEELPAVALEAALRERVLGLEVVNAAVEGYSSVQQLAGFERELLDRYRPDYVVYVVSWAAIFTNALHEVTSTESADGVPRLWYFPGFLVPHLAEWPRTAGFAFAAVREAAWIYVSWRAWLRGVFLAGAADESVEATARYVDLLARRAAARDVPFLTLLYAPTSEKMRTHYRGYFYPPVVRAILDAITPSPAVDGSRLPAALERRGLSSASFSREERREVFGTESLGDEYHVDAAGARRFGAVMARKILEWPAFATAASARGRAKARAPLPSTKPGR